VRVGRFPVFLLRLCAVSGGLLCLSFLFVFFFLFGCFFLALVSVVVAVLLLVFGVAGRFVSSAVAALRLSCRCLVRGSWWCPVSVLSFLRLALAAFGWRGLLFVCPRGVSVLLPCRAASWVAAVGFP